MNTAGKIGEDLVAEYYAGMGFKIIERNYIPPFGKATGEIDLIACKDKEIVFVEVKTRSNNRFGNSFEAVDIFKQRKLVRTVKLYIHTHPQYQEFNYRIDVAGVDVDNIEKPVIILANAIEDFD